MTTFVSHHTVCCVLGMNSSCFVITFIKKIDSRVREYISCAFFVWMYEYTEYVFWRIVCQKNISHIRSKHILFWKFQSPRLCCLRDKSFVICIPKVKIWEQLNVTVCFSFEKTQRIRLELLDFFYLHVIVLCMLKCYEHKRNCN